MLTVSVLVVRLAVDDGPQWCRNTGQAVAAFNGRIVTRAIDNPLSRPPVPLSQYDAEQSLLKTINSPLFRSDLMPRRPLNKRRECKREPIPIWLRYTRPAMIGLDSAGGDTREIVVPPLSDFPSLLSQLRVLQDLLMTGK